MCWEIDKEKLEAKIMADGCNITIANKSNNNIRKVVEQQKKYTQFYIECCYCAIFAFGSFGSWNIFVMFVRMYICVRLNVFVVDNFFSCVSFFDFTRISRSTRMFSQAIFLVCTFSLCVGRSFGCFVFTAWCEASWRSSSDNHCTYYVNKYAFGFLLFVYFSTFSTPSNWRFCIAFPTK